MTYTKPHRYADVKLNGVRSFYNFARKNVYDDVSTRESRISPRNDERVKRVELHAGPLIQPATFSTLLTMSSFQLPRAARFYFPPARPCR